LLCYPNNFLYNVVEIGNIGVHDTISEFLSPITTVSPYGYTIQGESSFTGEINIDSDNVSLKETEYTERRLPNIDCGRTFMTQNPDFSIDTVLLDALKNLAWGRPHVVIGVYGKAYDHDAAEKIRALRNYRNQVISLYRKVPSGIIINPVAMEKLIQIDECYIDAIITCQQEKGPLSLDLLPRIQKNSSQNSMLVKASYTGVQKGRGGR
jgi:hypothetical protein